MSDRLDLAEPPKVGEVWRHKYRTRRGARCLTLVLRVLLEPADDTRWAQRFVEHTDPAGDYRSTLEDFLRDNEQQCPATSRNAGRCVLPVGHGGFHQERYGAQWFVAGEGDAPRVTREMVTGRIGSSPSFHGDNLVVQYCALCGAAINALGPEGSAIAAIEDYTEVHRAWHDRLQRLLEAWS